MYPYIKGDLMKYLIKIEYDGSKFYGFQRLNDLPTIQKSLEEALSLVDQSNVIIKGAGRTDRGVHAHGLYWKIWLYDGTGRRGCQVSDSIRLRL